ncbi:hypothetical protein [Actinocorallia longicatena]
MRMWLEVAEKDEFAEVAGLVEWGCLAWAAQRGDEVDGVFVRLALEFRHQSTDGRLGWWTPGEVRRLLLEWIPDSVASGPETYPLALGSVRALLGYLDASGLLDPRGGTAADCLAEVDAVGPRYLELVREPKTPGAATIVMRAAFERGLDLADSEAVRTFLQDVKAGRTELDAGLIAQVLDGPRDEPPARKAPVLPVHVPDEAELRAAAESCGFLAMMREGIPPHELTYLEAWAEATGPAEGDVVEVWRRALLALLELEAAATEGSLFRVIYRDAVPDLLHTLYGMAAPVSAFSLAEATWLNCLRTEHPFLPTTAAERELSHADLLGGVGDVLDGLELLGAITVEDPEGLPFVALTPLATAILRGEYLAEGREAGRIGELTGAPPAGLLGVLVDHYPPDAAREELALWLAAHGDDPAPLLEAIRDCPFHGRAAALLWALTSDLETGPALLESLRTDPVLAPLALTRLTDLGTVGLDDLTEAEGGLVLAENFLTLLERRGPAALTARLAQLPDDSRQHVVASVLASGHPDEQGLTAFRAALTG